MVEDANLSFQFTTEMVALDLKIVPALEVQPEPVCGPEIARQP
jgi:hypothetical protein